MKVDRRQKDDLSRLGALMNGLGHLVRGSLGWLVRLMEENQWWEYEYDQQAEDDERRS
jgi:hypothetical protein